MKRHGTGCIGIGADLLAQLARRRAHGLAHEDLHLEAVTQLEDLEQRDIERVLPPAGKFADVEVDLVVVTPELAHGSGVHRAQARTAVLQRGWQGSVLVEQQRVVGKPADRVRPEGTARLPRVHHHHRHQRSLVEVAQEVACPAVQVRRIAPLAELLTHGNQLPLALGKRDAAPGPQGDHTAEQGALLGLCLQTCTREQQEDRGKNPHEGWQEGRGASKGLHGGRLKSRREV